MRFAGCLRGTATVLVALLLSCRPAARTTALETWIEPVTGMEFVRLPAGSFAMGSPTTAPGHEDAETLHEVRLAHSFFLQRTEVTQRQWQRVLGANPSQFSKCGEDCPVETVSLHDIEHFLGALTRITGELFRLPTEAEWEYACRAGGTAPPWPPAASTASDHANVDARYPMTGNPRGSFLDTPTPVGSYPANPWGLFDLHGNVWEWTADPYCPYPEGPVDDPRPECGAELRVIRGGSWTFDVASARCVTRYTHRPQDSGYSLGFRLVRELP